MAGGGGGSWKVAYADFVTAMMALFLVLWLTAQDVKIKEAVERAFQHPFASVTKQSVGIIPSKESPAVRSERGNFDSSSVVELTMLRRLAQDLVKTLQSNPDQPDDAPVKLELSPEGLRISIFDRARKAVFESDSDQFTPYGKWIFSTLAWEISRYSDFNIELEGHTEHGHKPAQTGQTNWELSTSRANAGRRVLQENGVRGEQVKKVAGFADTLPIANTAPQDEINRRVAVMMRIRSD